MCDLLLAGRSLELPDPEVAAVIAAFDGERTVDGFVDEATRITGNRERADGLVRALVEAQVLVPADQPWPEMAAVEHWIRRGWLDALLLHLRAGATRFSDDAVANPSSVPVDGLRELTDALPPPWTEHPDAPRTPLPSPIPRRELGTMRDVLLRRRSNRPWRRRSITARELHTLLAHASTETNQLREALAGADEQEHRLLHSAFTALVLYVFAGELGQKLLLLATALELSTFLTPAFLEHLADEVLGFDPRTTSPIEAIAVG